MKTLLKNGNVINVFTGEIIKTNVLICEEKIVGVGSYCDSDADESMDIAGKYLCPGLIDGHVHIESTMLLPYALSRACLPHGTTSIIADPHEIANVCGKKGIEFMIEASNGIPFDVFFTLPSCVPATKFDRAGATLSARDLEDFYSSPRVVGLAEMMNYPGVIFGDKQVLNKIEGAKKRGKTVNGHAPLLSGAELDKYIAAGIRDDHECSNMDEAVEKLRKGQRIMIREGSTAKNLDSLLPLFDQRYCDRCMLVSDDKHPHDLITHGHLDHSIRKAVSAGKDPVMAIKMATLVPAQHFGLNDLGAIAPGYLADLVVLDELNSFKVNSVFKKGKKVVCDGRIKDFSPPVISKKLLNKVKSSVNLKKMNENDFYITPNGCKARVISLIKNDLLTMEAVESLDFSSSNGISVENDILKIAVIERHKGLGEKGLGFVKGIGLKRGAIASTVAHDSHNLIVIGQNEADMAAACNGVIEMGGGLIAVLDGKAVVSLPLPVAGLMSDASAEKVAEMHRDLSKAALELGVDKDVSPFMAMSFLSLPVIPHLKLTTLGLVDVDSQGLVDLFVK